MGANSQTASAKSRRVATPLLNFSSIPTSPRLQASSTSAPRNCATPTTGLRRPNGWHKVWPSGVGARASTIRCQMGDKLFLRDELLLSASEILHCHARPFITKQDRDAGPKLFRRLKLLRDFCCR